MRKTISYQVAKSLGLKRYFTGKKCKRGHVSERMVSNCNCIACMYELAKQEYATNPKRWHSYDLEKNREIKRKSAKKSYTTNPDKFRKRSNEYRKNNPDKFRETRRKTYLKHYDKNYQKYLVNARNRKARKRGAEGKYTASDVSRLRETQNNLCAICAVNLGEVKAHVDHIIPLSKGGSNWPENLQLLCATCNLRKGAKLAA